MRHNVSTIIRHIRKKDNLFPYYAGKTLESSFLLCYNAQYEILCHRPHDQAGFIPINKTFITKQLIITSGETNYDSRYL